MRAYDLDLRKKVVNFILNGHSRAEAADVFDVSLSAVRRWHLRYINEGHVHPRKRLGRAPQIDSSKLIKYIESHPNARLIDMARELKFSKNGIAKHLKKIGYGYKKKALPTWKLKKAKEKSTSIL